MRTFIGTVALRSRVFMGLFWKFFEKSTTSGRRGGSFPNGVPTFFVHQLDKNHQPSSFNLIHAPLHVSMAILCLGGGYL